MPLLHAIVLGAVQGFSEFLPISSSGHLVIVPWIFGWDELTREPELNRTFDVALHMGTFVGAATYFRRDLVVFTVAGLRSIRRRSMAERDEQMAWLLLLSSVPAALVGALLDSVVEEQLSAEWLVGVMLIVFGLVLLWADRRPAIHGDEQFRVREALLMGVAQSLALQPGVSRSGATISMGRWLGFDRQAATRLSFLMSLPVIAGAGLYTGADVVMEGGLPPGMGPPFAWGMITSAVTGFIAVWGLLRLVRTTSFRPFVLYRVLLGLAVISIATA